MSLSPRAINTFLLLKLPAAFFCGVRAKALTKTECITSVRLRWINQNPFKSMFWAVQGMAAELTTGMLLTKSIQESNTNISMLLVGNKSNFYKKAVGKIKFICDQGDTAKELIDLTKKNITHKAWLKAKGFDETGDMVSEFDFEWSCKKR